MPCSTQTNTDDQTKCLCIRVLTDDRGARHLRPAVWSIPACGPLNSTDKPVCPEHRWGTGLWRGGWPDPTVHLCVPMNTENHETPTQTTGAYLKTCSIAVVFCAVCLLPSVQFCRTCTSTWNPSLKVPLRIKLRDVPTRNCSPLPSATARIVPYWSGTWW